MTKDKIRFSDDPRSNWKLRCNVGLTIEPYGYRQGQRVATITFDKYADEMSFKDIVLAIYRLKTNCITIFDSNESITELTDYLNKFISYCKININLISFDTPEVLKLNKVLVTYGQYVPGVDENDTIVLLASNETELVERQEEAERIRREHKFAGKIYIVHTYELDASSYEKVLNTSVHYKTKYQMMY